MILISIVVLTLGHTTMTASCGWSMVNLPYGNGAFRMSVILPPVDMKSGDAAKSLVADRFSKLSAKTFSHLVPVVSSLTLPKKS